MDSTGPQPLPAKKGMATSASTVCSGVLLLPRPGNAYRMAVEGESGGPRAYERLLVLAV